MLIVIAECKVQCHDESNNHVHAGAKPKQYSAAAIAAARSSINLSYAQCVALSDLLCSHHACILPRCVGPLTISQLCHLLAPLAGHPDLLARWKAALHTAVDALCTQRNIPPINWTSVSENVLEPSIRKPLRLSFSITCLDLSWNVSGVVAVCCFACPCDHFLLGLLSMCAGKTPLLFYQVH